MSDPPEFISIFNDVIGPVMRGPSSSHTAGAYRIALLSRSLFGVMPRSVRCVFDPEGSYAPTYLPLGVDKAFCAGIIGMDMLDELYDLAVGKARETMNVEFDIATLKHSEHPNTIMVELTGSSESDRLTIWARSTGGGVVEIFRLDDVPVRISGKSLDAVVRYSTIDVAEDARRLIRDDTAFHLVSMPETKSEPESELPDGQTMQVRIVTNLREDLSRLNAGKGVEQMRTASPVFFPQDGKALFENTSQMGDYAKDTKATLGEMGLAYECGLLGMTEMQAKNEMGTRYEIMRVSISDGLDEKHTRLEWLEPHAGDVLRASDEGRLPFGGIHSRVAARALAVMHTCNSRGVVCAAPTGGSAGVLPAVITALEEELSLDRDAVMRALFAAGAVGLVMAKRATFAAETAGCQVEIGVAGAMAAAAAVEAAGGTAIQALDAAAIALQNTMGSVCDPVGGGCEIPCHTRNALAASAAFTNADLILGGYPNPIPLDETIDASYDVGRQLPAELRCTARGGLAITPSALALVEKSDIRTAE